MAKEFQLFTVVAESDGTVCPRGWYYLISHSGLDQPIAYGPHLTRDLAIQERNAFLRRVGAIEYLFQPSAPPISTH
jgi:hypothetical protein